MKPRARAVAVAVLSVLAQPLASRAVERIPLPAAEPAPLPAAAPPADYLAVPDFLQQMGIESWWDVIQLSPFSASLGLTFDDQEQRLMSPGVATDRTSSRLATETFSIRNDGFGVLDKRFFTGSVGLGFMLAQARHETNGGETNENGRLDNYDFSGTFFPEGAYTGTIAANRSQNTYVLPSGTTTYSDYEGRSIMFNVRENNYLREKEWLPYFSANLRFAEQRERQETRAGNQNFRQDDLRRAVLFDFHDGGENSDLSFQYQYVKLDNYAYEQGSYDSQSVNAFHSIDFGPTLNRRLDSHLAYYSRGGASPDAEQKSLEVSEFLTIDHNVFRSSNYTYQYNRQDTFYGLTATHSGGAQLNQQVYNNLSVTAGLNGFQTTLPGGNLRTLGGAGSFDYSHNLLWNGNLRLTGGGGYSRSSTEVPAGVVQVVDAPYAVPPVVGTGNAILLKDRNIEASTIVVVVLKGGARVPAYEGIDYTIRVEGDQTSLVPNLASAVMLPGDALNVSYHYRVQPQSEYASTSRSATLGLDWTWIGFNASHDESDQKSLSGGDELLLDQRRDFATVYVHGSWDEITARFTGSMTDYDSTRLAYRENRLDQYVSWPLAPGMMLTFAGNQYRTKYRLPVHTTTGASYRVDLQWNYGNWITSGYAGHRTFSDPEQPHEKVDEAGVRIRRTWTKLDLSLAFGLQRRVRGSVSSENGYFHFGAVRRF